MPDEKKTFPHKIGWEMLSKMIVSSLRASYAQMVRHNGNGVEQLIVGSGGPLPGLIELPTGQKAPKNNGVAMVLVVVPVGCQEDSEAFCKWFAEQASALLEQARAAEPVEETQEGGLVDEQGT